jgi:hypothetical protein
VRVCVRRSMLRSTTLLRWKLVVDVDAAARCVVEEGAAGARFAAVA